MEKIQKEIFSMEQCMQDMQNKRKSSLNVYLIDLIGSTLGVLVFSGILAIASAAVSPQERPIILGVLLFLWTLPIGCGLYMALTWIRSGRTIQNATFTIVKAKLDAIRLDETRAPGGKWLYTHGNRHFDPVVFYFSVYGRYVVPGANFAWSKQYRLSDQGLEHCSFSGDEFYLLIAEAREKGHHAASNHIAYAYPAKLFIWQDENVQK